MPQPVLYKNRVYVAVGQDRSTAKASEFCPCIDPTKTGDITQSGKIWSFDKIHRSISTVSIDPEPVCCSSVTFRGSSLSRRRKWKTLLDLRP